MKKENLNLKISSLYFMFCAASACYYPFLTMYLKHKGLSYTQIGIALSINSIISIIFQPLWGYFTDKYLNKKITLSIGLFLSGIISIMFIYSNSFFMIILSISIFMIFLCPIFPVLDAYCYELVDIDKNLEYGKLRLMGSMGYAIFSLILGYVISFTNYNTPYLIYILLVFICIFIVKSIKLKCKKNNSFIKIHDVKKIFANKNFIIFLTSIMLINISLGANSNYLSILIEKTGGNVANLGLLWFIVAISELPLFFLGNKILKKYGTLRLYYIGLSFFVVRFLLDSMCSNYKVVLLIQLMQAVTFPLYTISSLEYLSSIFPSKLRACGMTIYSALGAGLGGFIGNLLGGILLQNLSVFTLFRVMSFTALCGLIIGLCLNKYKTA